MAKMTGVLFTFSIVVSSMQAINGHLFDNLQHWYTNNVESEMQLEARSLLPETGYWNFLLIGGIYGRMLHFLLTDTEGFGEHIKQLNRMLKEKFGGEFYTNLESHVAESFPIADTLFKSKMLLTQLSDIRDDKTQKTLGDALCILGNIANDRDSVRRIVDEWGMVKQISNVFKEPNDYGIDRVDDAQVNKLKTLLLEHPEVFQKLLAQPDILNRLSGSVLESLRGIDLIKGVQAVQEMAALLKTLYPENYQQISGELLQIRDEQTGLSFGEGLETVSNIMQTPQFQHKLRKLFDSNALQRVHEISQQPLAEVVKPADLKEAMNKVKPEQLQKDLQTQGIKVSVEKAASLIEDAKNDRLMDMIMQRVANAEDEAGTLTADSVSKSFADVDIYVSPKKVTRMMQLLQIFPTEMIASTMESVGINVKFEDLFELVKKARQAAPLESFSETTPSVTEGTAQASEDMEALDLGESQLVEESPTLEESPTEETPSIEPLD